MKKKTLIILLLVAAIFNEGKAQTCVERVRSAIHKMNTPPDFEQGEGVRLQYSMVTRKVVNGVVRPFKSEAYFELAHDKVYVEADGNKTYQDDQYMVSVMNSEKVVYITPKQMYSDPQTMFKAVSALHDSIFSHVKVLKCEDEEVQKIELAVEKDLQKVVGIRQMNFEIQSKTGAVRKISLIYRKGDLIDVEINIMQIDRSQGLVPFTGRAVGKVLGPTGRLKPEYRDYKTVDLREN